MSNSQARPNLRVVSAHDGTGAGADASSSPHFAGPEVDAPKGPTTSDPLLTAEQVAERLNISKDWVWDHSSRKSPLLPVIRMGDGTLRYRASKIEEFIDERERLTTMGRRRRVK